MSASMPSLGLVIPVLNAASHLPALFAGLRTQTRQPDSVLFIDSSSDDATPALIREKGYPLLSIRREDFNHGATRQMAAERMRDLDFVLFMTQDAVPAHARAIEHLMAAFADPAVGLAYGRQLPHPGARPIEAHARYFNYGPRSRIKSSADVPQLGIKAAFASNSFAAYRQEALRAVGGFPAGVIFGEDTYVAARMIQAGWRVAYCAEAHVHHSHHYGFVQELRRHFDIGVFHAREPWLQTDFGRAEGEGIRYVKSEWNYLIHESPWLLPSALLRTALKLLGYRLGKVERRLPRALKTRLSMNRRFWRLSSDVAGRGR